MRGGKHVTWRGHHNKPILKTCVKSFLFCAWRSETAENDYEENDYGNK